MTAAGGQTGEGPQNTGGIPAERDGYPRPPGPAYPAYGPPPYPAYEQPAYPAYSPPAYPAYEQPAGPPPEFGPAPYPPAGQYGQPQPDVFAPVPPPPSGYRPPPPGYSPAPPPYGGGFPGVSYPGAYDYRGGHPAALPTTNTLAILSLVASVLGLACVVSSVAGIVLGGCAINQIRRTRQEGYGLAVAGIVLGIATLVIYLVFLTFA